MLDSQYDVEFYYYYAFRCTETISSNLMSINIATAAKHLVYLVLAAKAKFALCMKVQFHYNFIPFVSRLFRELGEKMIFHPPFLSWE